MGTFLYGKEIKIMNWRQDFLYIRGSYQQLSEESLLVKGCHTLYSAER
jgi:hypothetical protein